MQEKIKVTRKVKINPKNQYLGVAWNQHQASKLKHQHLKC